MNWQLLNKTDYELTSNKLLNLQYTDCQKLIANNVFQIYQLLYIGSIEKLNDKPL